MPATTAASASRPARPAALWLPGLADRDGVVVGSVRLWDVNVGTDRPALLLGPLVVNPTHRCQGLGTALMRHALRIAAQRRHGSILLVGDATYYGRFGFSADPTRAIWLPGLADNSRLLGMELKAGALDGARGMIQVPKKAARGRWLACSVDWRGLRRRDPAYRKRGRRANFRAAGIPSVKLGGYDDPLLERGVMANHPVSWPLRRPHRDGRPWLHRQRHAAAAGASYRLRPVAASPCSTRRTTGRKALCDERGVRLHQASA